MGGKLESTRHLRLWKMWHVNQDFRLCLVRNGEPLKDSEQCAPLHQSTALESIIWWLMHEGPARQENRNNSAEEWKSPRIIPKTSSELT